MLRCYPTILLGLSLFSFFSDISYAQNEIDKIKLNQTKLINHKEFILLQLNMGLLYSLQDVEGVKASGVEFDENRSKFLFKIEVDKNKFHYLSNAEKKNLVMNILTNRFIVQGQFLTPLINILEKPVLNLGQVLDICIFRFEKRYKTGGYEPLAYPKKRSYESQESYAKRDEKWRQDSELFSWLATYENNEVTLYK